jgi:hypothetical protein
MSKIEVNFINAETLQTFLARLFDEFRVAAEVGLRG